MNSIVKVRYIKEGGDISNFEYSYFTVERLCLNDTVMVPVKTGDLIKAIVTAVDVPESDIAAFADKVKTIPAGSLLKMPVMTHLDFPSFEEPAAAIGLTAEFAGPAPVFDAAIHTRKLEAQFEPGPYDLSKIVTPAPVIHPMTPAAQEYLEKVVEPAILKEVHKNDPPGLVTVQSVKVSPIGDPAYGALALEVVSLLTYAKERVIVSDQDAKNATDDLILIAKLSKAIEELRDGYVRPLNTYVKSLNANFKELSGPIEEADKVTRGKILKYRAEVSAKIAAIEELNRKRDEVAQQEAALSGTGEFTQDTTPIVAPMAPAAKLSTQSGTLGETLVPQFEVIDFKALPDDYKMIDASKLGKVIRAASGNIVIPGVKITMVPGLRVTARK